MSDLESLKGSLSLFNEKADKLLRMSFVKTIFETKTGVTLSWKAREDGLYDEFHVRRGPEEEAIDAFVLTFRYFIQDNETTSFRKMADHYSSLPTDVCYKNEFDEVRNEVNAFLDSHPDFQIEYNGKMYSRREIMDIFMYGGLSHANASKKKLYDEWMSIPALKHLAENEFVYIISSIFEAIGWIKDLNDRVLKEFTSVATP